MVIRVCGFEVGTLGGTIGTDGADASTPFDAISGGSYVYDNTHVHRGSRAALLPNTATGTQRFRWNNGTSKAHLRMYVYLDAANTADRLLTWTGKTGVGTASTRSYLTSANKIRLGSLTSTNIANDPSAFPINQLVRLEHWADAGTSSTTGTFRFAYYLGDSTTAVWDSGDLTTNVADATGIIDENRFTSTGNANLWFDDVADKTGVDVTDWATPWLAANLLPSLTLTANQNVAASASVSVTATALDTDGSIATYAWSLIAPSTGAPSLTGASSATVSFTAGTAGNLYTLQCVVTDNDGGTTTRTTEVRVPVSTGTSLRHLALNGTGVGTWAITGGSATDGAALNDEVDTTYTESPATTSIETTRKVRLQPSAVRTGYQLKERLWQDVPGSPIVKVRLIEGTSAVRQEWTQAITTTPTEYPFTVTTPGAIVDPGFLSVEISAAV